MKGDSQTKAVQPIAARGSRLFNTIWAVAAVDANRLTTRTINGQKFSRKLVTPFPPHSASRHVRRCFQMPVEPPGLHCPHLRLVELNPSAPDNIAKSMSSSPPPPRLFDEPGASKIMQRWERVQNLECWSRSDKIGPVSHAWRKAGAGERSHAFQVTLYEETQ